MLGLRIRGGEGKGEGGGLAWMRRLGRWGGLWGWYEWVGYRDCRMVGGEKSWAMEWVMCG